MFFYGITEVTSINTRSLTKFYFNQMYNKKSIFISFKPFPYEFFIKYLKNKFLDFTDTNHEQKNNFENNHFWNQKLELEKKQKSTFFYIFHELDDLENFIFKQLEYFITKNKIELIILHEIDYEVSEIILSIFRYLKKINDCQILVKLFGKNCPFQRLNLEYCIDWRYHIEEKDHFLFIKDLITGEYFTEKF